MNLRIGEISKKWAEKSHLPVWYEPVAISTNTIAKEKAISQEALSLYLTDHQTLGRGRGQNHWLDATEDSGSLLSSWVFLMRKPPHPVLSPAIGLAVWTALKASFPWLKLSLKAPNDLYLDDRKLAGILIESVQEESHTRLVVGLGVNVLTFPKGLETAISLQDRLTSELDETTWMNVLDRLLLELSLTVSQTREALSAAQAQGLLNALNRLPFLDNPYRQVDSDGSLWKGENKISWSEL